MTNSYKIAGGIVSALLLVSLLTLSRCGTELNPSHVKTGVDNSINLTVFEYKNEVKVTEAYYEFHNLKYDKTIDHIRYEVDGLVGV